MVITVQHWNKAEVTFLVSAYPRKSSREIAKSLNRSPKAIRRKAQRLHLHVLERSHSFPKPIKHLRSSRELAYLIGAILGDGCIGRYNGRYSITLVVKDFEFIYRVRQCLGCVVEKYPKIAPVKNSNGMLRIGMSNKSLFSILNKSLNELKPYIQPYSPSFLRGFFDAEGSAWIVKRKNTKKKVIRQGTIHYVNTHSKEPVVKYCNTDKVLLEYVRQLLLDLSIFPAPKMFVTKGNLGKNPKPCYNLHIYRKNSVRRFMNLIGTSIPRKMLTI